MKKSFFQPTAIILLCTVFSSCTKEKSTAGNYNPSVVREAFARKIAERIPRNYFKESIDQNNALNRTMEDFPLSERKIKNYFEIRDQKEIPALYIYNYDDGGFVVLSAETKHEPICAYVETSTINEEDSVPGPLIEWFGKTVENIEFVREGSYDNTERAAAAWLKLIAETDLKNYPEIPWQVPPPPPPAPCDESPWLTATVGPLLTTKWGQGCTFNDMCPLKGCTNICWNKENALTGCVATAMAQVVRYWKPENSYHYNYAEMPATQGNGEVQRLMRDAGHDVLMNYGCTASGAEGWRAPWALKGTIFMELPGFGLKSADRSDYEPGSYITVQENLKNKWPVILEGCASQKKVWLVFNKYSSCHMWVCDGYRESWNSCYSYLYFHMNWGWHEINFTGANDFIGWYGYNNWNPNTSNFQYARNFITNIHP